MPPKIGFTCILVVEMPDELPLIIERSKKLGATPILGVRIKLSSQAEGHWSESGGDRSIFGLNTSQVIQAVDLLAKEDMLDCLQMVHYHLGSQISNIREIRTAVNEACRVYAGLAKEGANVKYLDLGGGLAVDYDGSQSNFLSSRNYSIKEYCTDIIEAVMTSLDVEGIEHPMIITESGRALVAYYSLLLFNVLDVTKFRPDPLPDPLPDDCPAQIDYMVETLQKLTIRNLQESYNDTLFYRDEARQPVPPRQDQPETALPCRTDLLDDDHRNRPTVQGAETCHPRTRRYRAGPLGHLLLQFLRVPVSSRFLGHRPAVPDHADPPTR